MNLNIICLNTLQEEAIAFLLARNVPSVSEWRFSLFLSILGAKHGINRCLGM